MKRTRFLFAATTVALIGCSKTENNSDDGLVPAQITQAAPGTVATKPVGHPVIERDGGPAGAVGAAKGVSGNGKVVETMNAGGYTYVKLEGAGDDEWAAAPEAAVKVGDRLAYVGGMAMRDFRSNTLNRTFKVVYFVQGFSMDGAAVSARTSSNAGTSGVTPHAQPEASTVDLKGIVKAAGGLRIAEIYSAKEELSGKEVTLRGKVVKYNAGIMGRNWLHVRDGSGTDGSNDLTITTSAASGVGATVLVKGKIVLNKDFGAGYKYDVLIEDANVTAE